LSLDAAVVKAPHGRRPRGIRGALAMLCLALLLPVWIAVIAMVLRMAEVEREQIVMQGIGASRRAATSIEREFIGLRATLLALASAPSPGGLDLTALEVQAATLRTLFGIGLQVEARAEPGRPREVVIGQLESDAQTGQPVLPLSVALPGTPQRHLVLRADAAGFWSEALRRVALPKDWPVVVLDAEGRILSRLPVSDRIGQLLHERNRFLVAGAPQGRRRTTAEDGELYDISWQRVVATGWTVAVAVPAGREDAELFAAVWPLLATSATLTLVLPLGIWIWGSRRIVRPLAKLARLAAANGQERDLLRQEPSGIRQIDRVAAALHASALERGARQSAVVSNEAAFRRLLDHLPVGVVLVEAPSGRVLYLNARISEMSGVAVDLDGHVGKETTDWQASDAEGKRIAAADLPLARTLRTGRPEVGDYRLRRADGRLVWLRSMARPVRASQGDEAITGAVCVIVEVGNEYAAIRALGEQVSSEAVARGDAEAAATALAASEVRFRQFAEASPDAVWIHDPDFAAPVYVGPAAAALSGLPAERLANDPGAWMAAIFPDDRPRLREAMEAAASGRQATVEYRLRRADGAVIWIRDIAFPIGEKPGGAKAGTSRIGRLTHDATLRKGAEARQALLIAELNHRVKNTLATVQSIAQQTARNAGAGGDIGGFVATFTARLRALAQGHDLLTASAWTGAPMEALTAAVLAPWRGGRPPRMVVAGPPLWLGHRQALALALALHELATNAVEHGALALNGTGQARLTWEALPEGGTRMIWRESGGPLVDRPRREGFGSRLLGRGLAGELGPGASVALRYDPAGLCAEITFPPPPLPIEPGASRDRP
jgi:PAS domain S-box-containing protein